MFFFHSIWSYNHEYNNYHVHDSIPSIFCWLSSVFWTQIDFHWNVAYPLIRPSIGGYRGGWGGPGSPHGVLGGLVCNFRHSGTPHWLEHSQSVVAHLCAWEHYMHSLAYSIDYTAYSITYIQANYIQYIVYVIRKNKKAPNTIGRSIDANRKFSGKNFFESFQKFSSKFSIFKRYERVCHLKKNLLCVRPMTTKTYSI